MKHWEKNKKDNRRFEDRESFSQQSFHDSKKKKLKPIEKTKYRLKSAYDDED